MATTFTNKATLTFNGITAVSNTVTGEIADNLTVTKATLTDGYTTGTEKTFLITMTNTGETPLTGLTVSDDLGGYAFGEQTLTPLTYTGGSALYFINGTQQGSVSVTAGPPLVFTGISVPAGGTSTLIYNAAANEYAPLGAGASVNNTATVTGAALTAPATATAEVNADTAPELTLKKNLYPLTVAVGGTLTYTFTIENGGGAAEATDEIILSDVFDPALTGITATLDGAALAGTDYSYSAETGAFTVNPGTITVPAATYTQDPVTGVWSTVPGTAVLTVSGTV